MIVLYNIVQENIREEKVLRGVTRIDFSCGDVKIFLPDGRLPIIIDVDDLNNIIG